MSKFNLAKVANTVKLTVSKHGPEILTGLGIAGMFTATVLAVKATPKALMLIEEKKLDEDVDKLTPVETIKAAWKCYIPAAVTGITSTACLICANSVHAKRNAALATAYKLSEAAFVEYRDKVIETAGAKKEKVVREKLDQEKLDKKPITKTEVIVTEKGNTRILEPLSMRYFKSDRESVKRAENILNKRMLTDMFGYVSVNDWFDEIGLDHTEMGDAMGWNVYKSLDIDFSPGIADDGEPCLVIDYSNSRPQYNYTSFR